MAIVMLGLLAAMLLAWIIDWRVGAWTLVAELAAGAIVRGVSPQGRPAALAARSKPVDIGFLGGFALVLALFVVIAPG